ncbi:hypothetical protein [Psychrosphaera haliotis]|uniref:SGNH/GDSL hydrolase family protein n=1 Tax=Psychrosphaera haliotis TaxID=555083 RepID=A0A6N8F3X9_9GAMM|nr:hypothetical protein [Psychrosphaera haliotis]MUH71376.1 hypothetical protein [Psychrosphaera haliotis]
MSIKIYIFGDSHTHCLKRAWKHNENKSLKEDVKIVTFSKIKNGTTIGDITVEELISELHTLDESTYVVSCTGGNQHNVLSLIQHPIKFTQASLIDNLGSEVVIPEQAFRELFLKGMANDMKRLSTIKDAVKQRINHVVAPPPKKDEAHILKRHETDFTKKNIIGNGVTEPYLRLEIYKHQVFATKTLCEHEEINIIDFPAEAKDKDGFLKESYYAPDATHANELFGKLLLDKIYAQITAGA